MTLAAASQPTPTPDTEPDVFVRSPFALLIAASVGCVLLATSAALALEVVDLTAGDAYVAAASTGAAAPAIRTAGLERSLAAR